MKLPEKIKGRNKVRDGAIVLLFKIDGWDFPQLCKRFALTEMRIRQILMANHAFIPRNKEWEKELRINRLKRWLRESPKTTRDPVEIQELLRREIEGEKTDNLSIQNIVIVRVNESGTAKSSPENVARQVHIQPQEVSGDVVKLGDREINVVDIPGHVIQRADPQ
jgi:hypothetical protein